ncbi:hypothetical protein FGO68_gene11704 [Halteria grandinella]|uniref:Uncharacterized protein n=1 Tax=Halteria grandinella TaxID=5974 RepID=A0A8J8NM61_HALGN|nr:hypothetical protein FGO68_gene11704 [Halteria grandinella]
MRRFSLNDKLNAAIAGALSAISLLVDEKQRRVFFALVLFSRALVRYLPELPAKARPLLQVQPRGGPLLGPHGLLQQVSHVLRARVPRTQLPWLLLQVLSHDEKRQRFLWAVGLAHGERLCMKSQFASLFINHQRAFTRLNACRAASHHVYYSLCTYTYKPLFSE